MRDLARLARLDVALNFLYLGTCWALILLSVWLFAVERSWLTFALAFLVVVFTLLFGWWAYPLLWLLPLGTLTATMHMVRNFCEHAISDDEAAAHGDRLISIRSNPIERALIAPFYMNYHAEHHLF